MPTMKSTTPSGMPGIMAGRELRIVSGVMFDPARAASQAARRPSPSSPARMRMREAGR